MNILIVDDQRSARRVLADLLASITGCTLYEAGSLAEARQRLSQHTIDVALIDIRLDADARNRDGLTLVGELRNTSTAAVVVTVFSELAEIRTAMRLGARDYILKDELCEELLVPIVEGLRDRRALEREVLDLRARRAAADDELLEGLVGTSPAMRRLAGMIRRVVLSERPVLVTGPTGSGKEKVVRALHALGPHPDEPLLDVNCGAIPEQLMESQLFGHEKGAFTGADRRHEGFFAAVRQGTLFLDELAELPLGLQAKLLRVLETGRFRPLGATADCPFQGRVVAATHADLEARVKERLFREDLLYRLNVLELRVPALEERREDIPMLLAHFARQQRRPLRFTAGAVEWLTRSSWPGNVRQLRNLVDRLAVFAEDDLITPEVLEDISGGKRPGPPAEEPLQALARTVLALPPSGDKLEQVEQALIAEAMAMAGGNKSGAARLLGVNRKAIERRLERSPDADEPVAD